MNVALELQPAWTTLAVSTKMGPMPASVTLDMIMSTANALVRRSVIISKSDDYFAMKDILDYLQVGSRPFNAGWRWSVLLS